MLRNNLFKKRSQNSEKTNTWKEFRLDMRSNSYCNNLNHNEVVSAGNASLTSYICCTYKIDQRIVFLHLKKAQSYTIEYQMIL